MLSGDANPSVGADEGQSGAELPGNAAGPSQDSKESGRSKRLVVELVVALLALGLAMSFAGSYVNGSNAAPD